MQARGASWGKCSGGQILARNSSRLVYSLMSVSPGLNEGIKCHGRNEFPVEPPVAVDPPPLEVSIFPGSTHFRSKQPGCQRWALWLRYQCWTGNGPHNKIFHLDHLINRPWPQGKKMDSLSKLVTLLDLMATPANHHPTANHALLHTPWPPESSWAYMDMRQHGQGIEACMFGDGCLEKHNV